MPWGIPAIVEGSVVSEAAAHVIQMFICRAVNGRSMLRPYQR